MKNKIINLFLQIQEIAKNRFVKKIKKKWKKRDKLVVLENKSYNK